jgi:hypothetical protein
MERGRQLLGEMLVYCFVVVLATGGFLVFFYVPSGEMVAYDGWYEPLRGIQVSAAYDSLLRISMEVRGGLLIRQLHLSSSTLLIVGIVGWAALGRFRYSLAVLAVALIAVLSGYAATDEVLSGTLLGTFSSLGWYVLHLLPALVVGVMLVISSRHEAARNPRTLSFVALSLCLTLLVFLWP